MSEEKSKEGGGMKSALEIALERTARFKQEAAGGPLTPEQKAQIGEIEKEYAAKLAEKEIMLQSKLKELALKFGQSQELAAQAELLQQNFAKEQAALREEKEARIQEIRQRKD